MEKIIILQGITVDELIERFEKAMPRDSLLTHAQVRELLLISETEYRKMRKAGQIPVRGLGTKERVLESELLAAFKPLAF